MRTQKPRLPFLRIGHPLTVGLTSALCFNEGNGTKLRDIARRSFVSHANFTAGLAAPFWRGGPYGPQFVFDGNDVTDLGYIDTGITALSSDWTIIMIAGHNITGQVTAYPRFFSKDSAGLSTIQLIRDADVGGGSFVSLVDGIDGSLAISSAGLTDGRLVHFSLRKQGTAITFSIDGMRTSQGGTVGTPSYGSNGIYLGNRSTAASQDRPLNGPCDFFGMWNYALPNSLIRDHKEDPFEFVAPSNIEYFLPATQDTALTVTPSVTDVVVVAPAAASTMKVHPVAVGVSVVAPAAQLSFAAGTASVSALAPAVFGSTITSRPVAVGVSVSNQALGIRHGTTTTQVAVAAQGVTQVQANIFMHVQSQNMIPCSVWFDAYDSIVSGGRVMHESKCVWTILLGAGLIVSREGPSLTHVFETAGTYTVFLSIQDQNGFVGQTSQPFTLSNFAGTQKYVAVGGVNTPAGGSIGSPWATPDYAISQLNLSAGSVVNYQINLNRGDNWNTTGLSIPTLLQGSVVSIQAYGSGLKPHIHGTGSGAILDLGTNTNGVRLVDLEISGPSYLGGNTDAVHNFGRDFLMLRCDLHDTTRHVYDSNATLNDPSSFDQTLQGCEIYNAGQYPVYGGSSRFSMIDCDVHGGFNVAGLYGICRIFAANKNYWFFNRITRGAGINEAFYPCLGFDDDIEGIAYFTYMAQNYIDAHTALGAHSGGLPWSGFPRDILIEGNTFKQRDTLSPIGNIGREMEESLRLDPVFGCTIRNNKFVGGTAIAKYTGLAIGPGNVAGQGPIYGDIAVYNNSFYKPPTGTGIAYGSFINTSNGGNGALGSDIRNIRMWNNAYHFTNADGEARKFINIQGSFDHATQLQSNGNFVYNTAQPGGFATVGGTQYTLLSWRTAFPGRDSGSFVDQNPQYRNPSIGDLAPDVGSPLIDSGVFVLGLFSDFDFQGRVLPYSIGAFEGLSNTVAVTAALVVAPPVTARITVTPAVVSVTVATPTATPRLVVNPAVATLTAVAPSIAYSLAVTPSVVNVLVAPQVVSTGGLIITVTALDVSVSSPGASGSTGVGGVIVFTPVALSVSVGTGNFNLSTTISWRVVALVVDVTAPESPTVCTFIQTVCDDICVINLWNRVALHLSLPAIKANDENTPLSNAIRNNWDFLRKEFLCDHPWNGSKDDADLSLSDFTPTSRWSYAFELPNCCLRIFSFNGEDNRESRDKWERVPHPNRDRTVLVANETTAHIEYATDIAYTEMLGPKALGALALWIALNLADKFGKNENQIARIKRMYEEALGDAKSIDGQEQYPEEFNDDDVLNGMA